MHFRQFKVWIQGYIYIIQVYIPKLFLLIIIVKKRVNCKTQLDSLLKKITNYTWRNHQQTNLTGWAWQGTCIQVFLSFHPPAGLQGENMRARSPSPPPRNSRASSSTPSPVECLLPWTRLLPWTFCCASIFLLSLRCCC